MRIIVTLIYLNNKIQKKYWITRNAIRISSVKNNLHIPTCIKKRMTIVLLFMKKIYKKFIFGGYHLMNIL